MLMAIKPQDVQTTQQLAVLMEKNPSANSDLHRYIPLITLTFFQHGFRISQWPRWVCHADVYCIVLDIFGIVQTAIYTGQDGQGETDLVFTSMTWLWL
jgi:hypothetical protein